MADAWTTRDVVTVILAAALGLGWMVALIVAVFDANPVGQALQDWLAVVGGVFVGFVAGSKDRA